MLISFDGISYDGDCYRIEFFYDEKFTDSHTEFADVLLVETDEAHE